MSQSVDSPVGSVHSQTNTCGSEGVTNAERSSPVVQLLHGDATDLLLQAKVVLAEVVRVQGIDVGQKLE